MSLIERAASHKGPKPKPKQSPALQATAQRRPSKAVPEMDDWVTDYERDVNDAAAGSTGGQASLARERVNKTKNPLPAEKKRTSGGAAVMPQVIAQSSAKPPTKRGRSKSKTQDQNNSASSQSREFELDFTRLQKFGFITPEGRRSRISEEFRLIKRRLMQRMSLNARNRKKQRGREHVILITSSRPSEGKSFIAVNLALSIIMDEGFNVMLVDADVARPSISNIFGLRNDLPGLTDLLLGEESRLSDVLLREANNPLSVLVAGGAVDSATDLFGGDDMRQLVTDIASRYTDRIIIFDAPPLLASTEPVALAEHAGQTVLVVDAERTSRAAIDSALDLLETDQNVNLVLNKTTIRNRTEQFGSYYEAYNQTTA